MKLTLNQSHMSTILNNNNPSISSMNGTENNQNLFSTIQTEDQNPIESLSSSNQCNMNDPTSDNLLVYVEEILLILDQREKSSTTDNV